MNECYQPFNLGGTEGSACLTEEQEYVDLGDIHIG